MEWEVDGNRTKNSYMRLFFFPLKFFTDEMNVCVVEKCNHLADAIGKIDEAIEQIEMLNISVKKQRSDVLTVAERCAELCAQIKIGIQYGILQYTSRLDIKLSTSFSLKPLFNETKLTFHVLPSNGFRM